MSWLNNSQGMFVIEFLRQKSGIIKRTRRVEWVIEQREFSQPDRVLVRLFEPGAARDSGRQDRVQQGEGAFRRIIRRKLHTSNRDRAGPHRHQAICRATNWTDIRNRLAPRRLGGSVLRATWRWRSSGRTSVHSHRALRVNGVCRDCQRRFLFVLDLHRRRHFREVGFPPLFGLLGGPSADLS